MTDKEKLIKIKSLADKMYNAAFNLTTDASLLRKVMDEYHQFTIYEYHKEEPVSEELEEAARNYSNDLDNICGSVGEQTRNAFKAGAKWQEEKDNEEKVLTYKHGFNDCKEQMMAKGVDGVVTLDYYGEDNKEYGCVAHDSFCLEDFELKDMDKVKIILIKED